jgi:hypothetical protein
VAAVRAAAVTVAAAVTPVAVRAAAVTVANYVPPQSLRPARRFSASCVSRASPYLAQSEHRAALNAVIEEWTRACTKHEVMRIPIKRAGVPAILLFQTENAISISYLSILTLVGNLP